MKSLRVGLIFAVLALLGPATAAVGDNSNGRARGTCYHRVCAV